MSKFTTLLHRVSATSLQQMVTSGTPQGCPGLLLSPACLHLHTLTSSHCKPRTLRLRQRGAVGLQDPAHRLLIPTATSGPNRDESCSTSAVCRHPACLPWRPAPPTQRARSLPRHRLSTPRTKPQKAANLASSRRDRQADHPHPLPARRSHYMLLLLRRPICSIWRIFWI